MKLAIRALSMGLLGVASIAAISASAVAQIDPQPAASPVAWYGVGGQGTGGYTPMLTTNGVPHIGDQAFEVRAEGLVGGSWGLLLYSAVGVDQPLPGIGRLYVAGGAFWPTPFVADGAVGVAGAGSASIPIPLPGMPSLIGQSMYLQGFFKDAGAAAGGQVSHSKGMKLTGTVPAWSNSLGMEFARIPAGTFMMGSPTTETYRWSDESLHQVTLTKSFFMQTTEVTQAQWWAVMGTNPSYNQGSADQLYDVEVAWNSPVEQVSWVDVQAFIVALNALEPGANYRLPTEAEWEYACRAGSATAYVFGDSAADWQLDLYGFYWCYWDDHHWMQALGQYPLVAKDVAILAPNDWGLYDMHGNVWEWCQDLYGGYPSTSTIDPQGPGFGTYRVIRGGGWHSEARYCRSAHRRNEFAYARRNDLGFRLVREVQGP